MGPDVTDQTPAASFIMLCYRQPDTVAAAVRSMLEQECEPIEIIVSDDASPDDTFARVEEAVRGYDGPHTVTVRRNPQNMGVNKHLEVAMTLAQSDLMVWTAGDDINAPDRVQTILDVHRETGAMLIFSDAETITPQGTPGTNAYRNALFYRRHTLAEAAGSFALYLGATVAWHKDLYRKYGGFPRERAHEDLILGFRAALEDSVHHIPRNLVTYREDAGVSSILSGKTSTMVNRERRRAILQGQLTVLQQRLKDAGTFGLPDDHPVCRILSRQIQRQAMRLSYYDGNRLSHARAPLRLASSLLSEWLRDVRNR